MTGISLGNPIALGRTAEIYAWQDHQILKLYRDGFPPELADYKAKIARNVQEHGLPVPAIGDMEREQVPAMIQRGLRK